MSTYIDKKCISRWYELSFHGSILVNLITTKEYLSQNSLTFQVSDFLSSRKEDDYFYLNLYQNVPSGNLSSSLRFLENGEVMVMAPVLFDEQWWFWFDGLPMNTVPKLEWKWDNLGLYDFPYGYVELASDDESQTSESRWLSDLTWQFLVSISVIRDINGRFRDFTKRGAPLVCRLSACWGMRAEDGTSTITEGLYVRRNWPDNIWLVVWNIFYFP